jgi:hypothetical protein
MTDDYSWLDDERRGTEIYVDRVHPACVCTWDLNVRDPNLLPVKRLPAMKLIARRKTCVIHGAKGSI